MLIVGVLAGLSLLAVLVFSLTALTGKVLEFLLYGEGEKDGWWRLPAWMAFGFGFAMPALLGSVALSATVGAAIAGFNLWGR